MAATWQCAPLGLRHVSEKSGGISSLSCHRSKGLCQLSPSPSRLPPASWPPATWHAPAWRHVAVRAHTETQEAAAVDRRTCPAVKPTVELSALEAMDVRVGLITDAKTVLDREQSEKRGKPTPSRKYLKLEVDIGCESRTIVSECRYVMDVEDAVGKKVMFVANVPPVEVEGIQSHGVLLAGLNYDPTPMPRSFKLILPGLGRLPPGSQILGAAIPR